MSERPRPVPARPDLFSALIDRLAEMIANRVVASVDAHLEARSVPQAAYRVDEAARVLGLSEREVKRRIASGELASVKVGRARLIPRPALTAFLEGRGGDAAA